MRICARNVEWLEACVSSGTVTRRHAVVESVVHVCCDPPPSWVPPRPQRTTQTPAGAPVADRNQTENEKLCPVVVASGTSWYSDATPPPPREPVFICRKYCPSCAVPSW